MVDIIKYHTENENTVSKDWLRSKVTKNILTIITVEYLLQPKATEINKSSMYQNLIIQQY